MALVNCPECNHEIYNGLGTICPSCGYRIKQIISKTKEKETKKIETEIKEETLISYSVSKEEYEKYEIYFSKQNSKYYVKIQSKIYDPESALIIDNIKLDFKISNISTKMKYILLFKESVKMSDSTKLIASIYSIQKEAEDEAYKKACAKYKDSKQVLGINKKIKTKKEIQEEQQASYLERHGGGYRGDEHGRARCALSPNIFFNFFSFE